MFSPAQLGGSVSETSPSHQEVHYALVCISSGWTQTGTIGQQRILDTHKGLDTVRGSLLTHFGLHLFRVLQRYGEEHGHAR